MNLEQYRYFLKDSIRKTIDFSKTDQSKGIKAPPIEKPYSAKSNWIELITADWKKFLTLVFQKPQKQKVVGIIIKTLTLLRTSFLLWATQGIPCMLEISLQCPSAGCRHARNILSGFNVETDELKKSNPNISLSSIDSRTAL